MKKIFSKTAFTLIELIVSLALVSVIVLGILAISTVLSNNGQDYGQRYLVKSETQIALNHILNNASLAVGSANTNDEGILYKGNYPGFDPNSFCIHQAGTGDVPPGQNLINWPSDIWLCYTWSPATYQINWCAETYSGPGADPRGASSCSTSVTRIPNPQTGTNTTFLGTAYSISNPSPLSFNSTTGFSITIQNCLNDSASSCYNPNPALQDPANNPQAQVSGSVFPPQEGTG